MKKRKKEKIYKSFDLDISRFEFNSIEDIITYFNEVKKQIPSDAYLKFDSDSWNSGIDKMYFSWYTEETNEEYKQRIQNEKLENERQLSYLKQQEQQIKENLAKIQKKMSGYEL